MKYFVIAVCLLGLTWATCPAAVDWSGRACSCDAECFESPNSECYNGKCLCTPGYFYSVSTFQCLARCTNLDDTYTKYPNTGIVGHNIQSISDENVYACLDMCTSDSQCLNLEYERGRPHDCNTHHVTVLQAGSDYRGKDHPGDEGWDFYVRNCA